ncbi:MAG: amidase [Dehalococcoidia bacterium]
MTATRIDPFAPVTAMLRALRSGVISSKELLDLHLQRIERYNARLNAIVETDFDNARRGAEAADAARARGEQAALLGLPLTLKESMNVRGLRTTVGVETWAGFRSEHDGAIAQHVRAAGGVLMGKTNVPPFLMDWHADNPVYGRTNNPWDLERTPGGSTGGGAAALAAGLTPLEYGSDIGGSIRVPAAWCGLYGHKPSETAVPRSGQFPVPPMPNSATAMGVQGPLARSAEDLETALDVICGPEVGEDTAWRLEFPAARHERLNEFRVAVLPAIPWLPVDAEILAAQERLIGQLGRAGAIVREAQPESFGDLRKHQETYQSLLAAITTVTQTAEQRHQAAEGLRKAAAEDAFVAAQVRGLEASAADYILLHEERERVRAAYRSFFRDWDVLLCPITLVPALKHIDPSSSFGQRRIEVNGKEVPYGHQVAYPAVATLAGQPATAFPAGFTRSGLPIGLQAIGPYLEDRTPIRFVTLLEREFGGFRRPVGYDD